MQHVFARFAQLTEKWERSHDQSDQPEECGSDAKNRGQPTLTHTHTHMQQLPDVSASSRSNRRKNMCPDNGLSHNLLKWWQCLPISLCFPSFQQSCISHHLRNHRTTLMVNTISCCFDLSYLRLSWAEASSDWTSFVWDSGRVPRKSS